MNALKACGCRWRKTSNNTLCDYLILSLFGVCTTLSVHLSKVIFSSDRRSEINLGEKRRQNPIKGINCEFSAG